MGKEVTNIYFCTALREMSANFMRVTRGVGRPEELVAQAMAIVSEYEKLRAAGLTLKVDDIHAALAIAKPGKGLVPAQESFIEASLRIAAARQDGNRLQEHAGEKDMLDAMRAHHVIIKGEL